MCVCVWWWERGEGDGWELGSGLHVQTALHCLCIIISLPRISLSVCLSAYQSVWLPVALSDRSAALMGETEGPVSTQQEYGMSDVSLCRETSCNKRMKCICGNKAESLQTCWWLCETVGYIGLALFCADGEHQHANTVFTFSRYNVCCGHLVVLSCTKPKVEPGLMRAGRLADGTWRSYPKLLQFILCRQDTEICTKCHANLSSSCWGMSLTTMDVNLLAFFGLCTSDSRGRRQAVFTLSIRSSICLSVCLSVPLKWMW